MSLGDLIKTIAPVVAGAYLGPVGGAIATGLGSVALGEKPKDALRAALLSGLGGVGAQKFLPAKQAAESATTAGSLMAQGADPRMANIVANSARNIGRKAIEGREAYFTRRTGGIDPSEGSGTKDDVPAMLNAGEFVMTREAVKGAGNGSLDKGISRMYNMMDKFERMA